MRKPIAELKDRLQLAMDMNNKKAIDLANDLDIPKSAISQYLSGKSKKLDSIRIFIIAEYLNVSEAWLMGFDVPMERPKMNKMSSDKTKNSDAIIRITDRLIKDVSFFEMIEKLKQLIPEMDILAGMGYCGNDEDIYRIAMESYCEQDFSENLSV